MKKFSDLNTNVNVPEAPVHQIEENLQPISNEENSNQIGFPEYLINDSIVLGYAYEETQYTIYNSAKSFTIQTGYESVLDVGCGRGDFGNYLLQQFPNIRYTGIDLNSLLIEVGNTKYSNLSVENFMLMNLQFNPQYPTDVTYDWVYHITDLTLDYGTHDELNTNPLKRYEMLEWNIVKSLELCTVGCVFMLLNDKENSQGYLNYSYSPITEILYRLNAKFAFDNSDLPNVTKLVILKQPF
jgi:hypothetical protein